MRNIHTKDKSLLSKQCDENAILHDSKIVSFNLFENLFYFKSDVLHYSD